LLDGLRKPPFSDVLVCIVVIALNLALAPKMRVASDALFLEGMPLSVVGATIVLSKGIIRTPLRITKRLPGMRILAIGTVLVLASIVIGEALHLR
jgi:hypothetical protein